MVAVANPLNLSLVSSLAEMVGSKIDVRLAAKSGNPPSHRPCLRLKQSVAKAADAAVAGSSGQNFKQLVQLASRGSEVDADERPVVSAVDFMMRYAFDHRASDIHIEPRRETSLVRMRIDGVLHGVHTLPISVHTPIVSRIKTLARMNIAEKRRPQDGRIKTVRGEREVELRVSSIPTAFGEKLVLRVFDPEVAVQNIGQLGF